MCRLDWIATTTEEPEEPQTTEPPRAPKSPWKVQESPSCNNVEDFRGHADINALEQICGSIGACGNAPKWFGESSGRKRSYTFRRSDYHDINYDYSVSWEFGCTTDSITQNLLQPLGEDGPSCVELMTRAYRECECELRTEAWFLWAGSLIFYLQATTRELEVVSRLDV